MQNSDCTSRALFADLNSSDRFNPLEVFSDACESMWISRFATKAGDKAGNSDSHVLATALLVVEGAARVTLKFRIKF